MHPCLNHVALLTSSVHGSAAVLKKMGYHTCPEEKFKETNEIYVGSPEEDRSLLLLMEPAGPGSYQRALKKRGPGLHHLAIDVENIRDFLRSLSGSGWFLLPQSVHTLETQKTAWLARPGFPSLVELQERTDMAERASVFVEKLEIPHFHEHATFLKPFGMKELAASPDDNFWVTLPRETRISFREIL